MTATEPRPLTAAVDIAAPPEAVWAVVGDVRRTGEWSPECTGVTPIRGVRRGGLLLGRNRRGPVRWVTLSRLTVVEPPRTIAWTVLQNRAEWRYDLQPTDGGTRLTQTRAMPRGESRFAVWFANRLLGGVQNHDDELERGMAAGLERIRALAER
ncbi:SRPBCC family protein [Jatrophihabitans fulvus]